MKKKASLLLLIIVHKHELRRPVLDFWERNAVPFLSDIWL